jgi:hypothetical protein
MAEILRVGRNLIEPQNEARTVVPTPAEPTMSIRCWLSTPSNSPVSADEIGSLGGQFAGEIGRGNAAVHQEVAAGDRGR